MFAGADLDTSTYFIMQVGLRREVISVTTPIPSVSRTSPEF